MVACCKMKSDDITRRGLLLGGLALMISGCMSADPGAEPISYALEPERGLNPAFRREHVRYQGSEPVGTVVVNTSERFLYHVEEGGWATRYGVAVGEQGLTLKGKATIGNKVEWPSWTPTPNMMRRKPRLLQYADGVAGGPSNPLGARALYLYRDGHDTMFRLHGTNEPWTIGTAVSNGCVRLTNEDIVDLYQRVPMGATVLIT